MKKILCFLYIFCFVNLSLSEEKEVSVNDALINKNLIHFIVRFIFLIADSLIFLLLTTFIFKLTES